jgi:hypothetical protein
MNKGEWIFVSILILTAGMLVYSHFYKTIPHTLSYSGCTIKYYLTDPSKAGMVYNATENKLALCLCKSYQQKKDTPIARKIMDMYNSNGNKIFFNTLHSKSYNKLDSILKHREMVFDTLVLLD